MKIKFLKRLMPRTGFTIFLLFFGIAALEAFQTRNWIAVGYWSLIALVFLILDNGTKKDFNKEGYKGS